MKISWSVCTNFWLTILVLLMFLSSCTIRPRAKLKPVAEPESFTLAVPDSLPLLSEYRLGFGDVIEVKFFNNDQFNEILTVRPDGRISMQKVGEIQVAGMTPAALGNHIRAIYARIIRNPEVTVIVRNFGGHQVYVLGEVNNPGAFPVQRNMTILQALAVAGGQKESAKMTSVLLMRRHQDNTVTTKRIDLSNATPAAMQENDIFLAAFDIVYVPKTFIANVNTFLDQALAGVIKPLDLYLRTAWYTQW